MKRQRLCSPLTFTLLSSLLSGLAAPGCGMGGDTGNLDATDAPGSDPGNSGNAADTAGESTGSVSGSAVITPPPYYITSDGQVRTPTTSYQSIRAWYLSREFRTRDKCRAHDLTPPATRPSRPRSCTRCPRPARSSTFLCS